MLNAVREVWKLIEDIRICNYLSHIGSTLFLIPEQMIWVRGEESEEGGEDGGGEGAEQENAERYKQDEREI